jgi:hypothetical protein
MSGIDDAVIRELKKNIVKLEADNAQLRDSVVNLCLQFACNAESPAGVMTGGLSALEEAFELLGWTDPHPTPESACDESGCGKIATCGFPVKGGPYRRTCYEHYCPEETT